MGRKNTSLIAVHSDLEKEILRVKDEFKKRKGRDITKIGASLLVAKKSRSGRINLDSELDYLFNKGVRL